MQIKNKQTKKQFCLVFSQSVAGDYCTLLRSTVPVTVGFSQVICRLPVVKDEGIVKVTWLVPERETVARLLDDKYDNNCSDGNRSNDQANWQQNVPTSLIFRHGIYCMNKKKRKSDIQSTALLQSKIQRKKKYHLPVVVGSWSNTIN